MEKNTKKTVGRKKAEPKVEETPAIFEETDQKVDTVNADDHADMMKMIKDLSSKVDRLEAEKAELKTTELKDESGEEILADDFLDIPAVFFSYSISFNLYGDKRRGKVVQTPTGEAIKFTPHYRYNKKNSGKRGTDTVSVCRATIHSKKTMEWLRSHTLFGIKFFEDIKSAIDQDMLVAEKMVAVSNMVSNLGDMQVIDRAKNEGIEIIDPDISNVRQQLIKRIATKQIESERKSREAIAKSLGMKETKTIGKQAELGDVTDVY
jgi:hypothetical protein